MAEIPPYPLYNRTYHLYRLSPLHHGDTPLLIERSLRTHSRRLKEQLKGDSVRGVQVDYAVTEDAARLGPLEECEWDIIGDEDAWIDRHRQLLEPEASQLSSVVTPEQARGVEVSLEYEKQSYNALLLRDPSATASVEGFTSLPLLLVKMPVAIREIFLNYLRTSFDAHVAPLKLASSFITSSLETYFRHLSASSSTQSIPDVVGQLQVQLSFPNATTLLKHLEINVASSDVAGFVSRGKLFKKPHDKPFTTALSSYLRKHLALDLSHPKVQISRISCRSFHLGTERLKLEAPDILGDTSLSDAGGGSQEASAGQLAVHDFFTSLVREAAGTGKFLPDELAGDVRSSTPSSTESGRVGRRKRAVSTTAAAGNGNTKRSKARGKENGRRVNGDEDMVDA